MNRSRAVIIKDGKLLVIHRFNNGKEYWVFPGGGVEPGETDEQAAVREAKEETSVDVKVDKLLYRHKYDDGTERLYYLCDYISGEPKLGDSVEKESMQKSTEHSWEPLWYPIGQLPQLKLLPLEIRDWLIEDLRHGFADIPREAFIKMDERREN